MKWRRKMDSDLSSSDCLRREPILQILRGAAGGVFSGAVSKPAAVTESIRNRKHVRRRVLLSEASRYLPCHDESVCVGIYFWWVEGLP